MTLREALLELMPLAQTPGRTAADVAPPQQSRHRRLEAAGQVVLNRLNTLAMRSCRGSLATSRDEAVSRVIESLLKRATARMLPRFSSDGECDRYASTALRNACLDEQRRQRGQEGEEALERAAAASPPGEPLAQEEQEGDAGRQLDERFEQMDRLFERVLTARKERYREGLENDYADLIALVRGRTTMGKLLEEREGMGPGASSAERTAATNRLHKRHQRLREALFEAIDAAEGGGSMPPQAAEEVRMTLKGLFRCREAANAAAARMRKKERSGAPASAGDHGHDEREDP